MALSKAGLKSDIKSEIDIKINSPDPDWSAGGADGAIQALADAVVDQITSNATAAVTCNSSGSCTNKITGGGPVPGAYSGTGTATASGTISGMSISGLKADIKSNIESLLSGVNWAAGNSDAVVGATAKAICDEIHNYGKITVTTSDSGAVAAGGGPVSGSGTGTGSIVSLSDSRLFAAFKTEIDAVVDEDVDWNAGGSAETLEATAIAIVDHIHSNAQVAVVTDLAGVTCPPPGGAGSGTAAETDAAIS